MKRRCSVAEQHHLEGYCEKEVDLSGVGRRERQLYPKFRSLKHPNFEKQKPCCLIRWLPFGLEGVGNRMVACFWLEERAGQLGWHSQGYLPKGVAAIQLCKINQFALKEIYFASRTVVLKVWSGNQHPRLHLVRCVNSEPHPRLTESDSCFQH